jgi:hypothetical protein
LSAALQVRSPARSQQAVVANADEAIGQDVLEEEAGELVTAEGSELGLVAVLAVLVAEDDGVAVVVDDAGVGDGDAMDVAGQVLDHV